jgi:RNA polymerase sigma factor (sigma-70 family)
MTNEPLLQAFVRDRSAATFEEILRRHGGLVYGVCRRSLGDRQDAEDAAQSVFLIFLEKAPRLGRGTVLSAWLYRTSVFVSRNLIRARSRREPRLPEPAALAGPPAWEEAKPHLDDALARLPQRLQDALVVHYLQGKTLAETAAALDCPLKTLEKRVGKGLERLRELLAGAGVAIGGAALVALLQQEAHAAAPPGIADALRARPIPPAAATPMLAILRKLLIPAGAALVAAGFIVSALRVRDGRRLDAPTPSHASVPGSGPTPGPNAASSGPSASVAQAAAAPFPATFEEFRLLFKRLIECPEDAERWAALGIGVRRDDLRAILRREDYDESGVDAMIVALFHEWAEREPRAAADWIYRAFALIPTTNEWKIQRPAGSGPGNATMLESVLDAWYRRDAPAVHAWAKALPSGPARNAVVVDLAIVASRQDPGCCADLAAILDALPPSWSRRVATARVAQEWATRDPKAAAAWILKLPARGPGDEVAVPTFTLDDPRSDPGLPPLATIDQDALFDKDHPEYATPRRKANELVEARLSALSNIARSWAASDLAAARLWSEGLEDPTERAEAMEAVGEVWAASDSRSVLDYARAHPEAEWSGGWLCIAATNLISRDPAAAESLMRLVPPALRDGLWSQVLQSLGRERPEEAAREAIAVLLQRDWKVVQGHYNGVLWTHLTTWTQRDPAGAAACAESLPKSPLQETVIGIIGQAWARSDPRAVLDWAQRLPEESRGRLVGLAVAELAPSDLDRARRTAMTLTEQAGRGEALYGVATAWGRTAPETALAWARSMPSQERDGCISNVLVAWAEKDADAARAQLGDILNEETRGETLLAIHASRMGTERARLRESLLRREEGKQSP